MWGTPSGRVHFNSCMTSALYARSVIDTVPIFKLRLRKPCVLFRLNDDTLKVAPDCKRIARRHTFITEKPVKELKQSMKQWDSPLEKKKFNVNAAMTEVHDSSMERKNTGSR